MDLFLKRLPLIILIIWVSALYVFLRQANTNETVVVNNTELQYWKDKDSLNNAKLAVLEGERASLMIVIDKKDKALVEALKDRKTKVFTRVETVTNFDTVISTKYDTVSKSFVGNYDNSWVKQKIRFKNDSLYVDSLVVNNKLELVEKKVKGGSELHIKQLNPYSTTNNAVIYKVKEKKANKGWWIALGVVVGTLVAW